MPKIKKTRLNPYGLTQKQSAVIADIINEVEQGKGLNPTASHRKIYASPNSNQLAYQNFQKIDFRTALLNGLTKRKILGKNSKVEKRLTEGLDAIFNKHPDFKTRLAYIQEINKISGVYAPEKKQTSRLNVNLDLTPEELKMRIKQLDQEISN